MACRFKSLIAGILQTSNYRTSDFGLGNKGKKDKILTNTTGLPFYLIFILWLEGKGVGEVWKIYG